MSKKSTRTEMNPKQYLRFIDNISMRCGKIERNLGKYACISYKQYPKYFQQI